MNITRAVAVLVFKEDTVLLVKHGEGAGHPTGTYGLPAGRNEGNESDIKAAIRELHEETGLVAEEAAVMNYPDNAYTADLPRKDGTVIRSTMRVFICEKYTGELRGSEETIPEWHKLSGLQELELLPNVALAIADAQRFLAT